MAGARQALRSKRIITHCPSNLHPTPSTALRLIASYSAQSQPASTRINTRTPSKVTCPAQGPSPSLKMQATMSPVPVPIPMLLRASGAQTTIAAGNIASNFGASLLRGPSTPSLLAPSRQRLVRHATAPEPRVYTPHPSRNKRKASFHELSPEVAERPAKRPKIEQSHSGTVAIHVAAGGSPQN